MPGKLSKSACTEVRGEVWPEHGLQPCLLRAAAVSPMKRSVPVTVGHHVHSAACCGSACYGGFPVMPKNFDSDVFEFGTPRYPMSAAFLAGRLAVCLPLDLLLEPELPPGCPLFLSRPVLLPTLAAQTSTRTPRWHQPNTSETVSRSLLLLFGDPVLLCGRPGRA